MSVDTVSFITTKRDDLFDVAAILTGGIAPEFMEDPENPVVVSVKGTMSSGKKILFDGTVQSLFGIEDARLKESYKKKAPWLTGVEEVSHFWELNRIPENLEIVDPLPEERNFFERVVDRIFGFLRKDPPSEPSSEPPELEETDWQEKLKTEKAGFMTEIHGNQLTFTGRADRDEYWFGYSKGQFVEVAYIDPMYAMGFSLPDLRNKFVVADITSAFIEREKLFGGITFVQNGIEPDDDTPWFTIHVEKFGKESVVGNGKLQSVRASENLRDHFDKQAKAQQEKTQGEDWVRFVKIEVHNEALRVSPQFRQALEALADKGPVFGKPAPENDNRAPAPAAPKPELAGVMA